MKRLLACSLLSLAIACGTDEPPEKKRDAVTILEPLTPYEAVQTAKLALGGGLGTSRFQTYAYCDRQYPETCSDEEQAYVLPREDDSDEYRLVFSTNQQEMAWTIFDYVTMSVYGNDVTEVGRFEWRKPQTGLEYKGRPRWNVPMPEPTEP